MATEFRVPDLGEGITEAEVLRVLVSEGDTVEQEQPIIEAETDKAIFEVPCDVAGRVTRVHVNEGDSITAGQVILTIEEVAVQAAPAVASPPEAAPASPPPEAAAPAAPASEPEREPAPAPAAAEVAASTVEPPSSPPPPTTPSPASAAPPVDGERAPAFASPAVRGFAREIGVDIYSVDGTGPGGRISAEDVKEHARTSRSDGGGAQAAAGPTAAPPLPDFSPFGATERERMSWVRRATARGMSESWSTIPHVTLFAKADVTALQEFRQRHRARAEAAGGNLTLLAIMLKIVAAGLKAFPKLNASADMETMETVYKRYYHVGVAVDTDSGLLVPVIREVDRKSIVELSVELAELAEKSRAGRLSLEEMRGASFTVSNLGGFGTGFFSPIINYPEVGVLGLGRAEMEPVYIDREFQPRLRMPLSLSHDHRLVDGAEAARFLQWIVQAVEEPLLMALEG